MSQSLFSTRLTIWACALAACCASTRLHGASAVSAGNNQLLALENESSLVEVALPCGRITRIRDKRAGIELISEPRLADNFKVSLPIRGRHAWQATEGNYILGREQPLTSHKKEGGSLMLDWAGVMKGSAGQSHSLTVRMTMTLLADGIQFNLRIENNSQAEIGEVYYPIIGGLQGIGDSARVRAETELVVPGLDEARKARIFETFTNMSWLGVLGPEQYYSYPDTISMPWAELSNGSLNRNVYFGAHDSARSRLENCQTTRARRLLLGSRACC